MSGLTQDQVAQLYRNQGREVPAEFADAPALKKRLEKYGRIKKEVDGILFDSTCEADAYQIVKLWKASGAICLLELQPVYVLQEGFRDKDGKWRRAVKYVADFSFKRCGEWRVGACGTRHREVLQPPITVDVKGIQTAAFRIKEKLFRQKFPEIDLQIWDRNKVKELSRL